MYKQVMIQVKQRNGRKCCKNDVNRMEGCLRFVFDKSKRREFTKLLNTIGTIDDLPFCCLEYGYKTKCVSCDVKEGGGRKVIKGGGRLKGLNQLPRYKKLEK